jgi:hypothetical protein
MAALGSATGIVVGAGVGAGAAVALNPVFEVPKQVAWKGLPNRIHDVTVLARLVAQGGLSHTEAIADALRDGYAQDKLDGLIYLSQTRPPVAQALTLWRRFALPDELWTDTLVHAGIDPRYFPYLNQLKVGELVGLGDVAMAVVRSILPSPPWMPVAPPAQGDKVKTFPRLDIDPVALAAKLGYDEEQLELMVGRSGLSMAPVMAANALFRDIIGPDDFLLAIAEGDLRTEWGWVVRETARQILTAGQYAELELRGYYDRATRLQNTAKHGMSTADSDLLYDVLGRAVAVKQVTTGLARGGKYPGSYANVPSPYRQAIQRSNIREEYAELAYANRYTYPSFFAVRAMLQGGVFTHAEAVQLLEEMGWKPELADKVATFYAPSGGPVADPYIGKAQTQLWTTTHRSYIGEMITDADADSALTAAGVTAAARPEVVKLWQAERDLIRKQLSPTQLRKAYQDAVQNPATGAPWTFAEAYDRLISLGYNHDDATTFLEEKGR